MKNKGDDTVTRNSLRGLKVGKVNGSDIFYELGLVDIEKEKMEEE